MGVWSLLKLSEKSYTLQSIPKIAIGLFSCLRSFKSIWKNCKREFKPLPPHPRRSCLSSHQHSSPARKKEKKKAPGFNRCIYICIQSISIRKVQCNTVASYIHFLQKRLRKEGDLFSTMVMALAGSVKTIVSLTSLKNTSSGEFGSCTLFLSLKGLLQYMTLMSLRTFSKRTMTGYRIPVWSTETTFPKSLYQ